MKKGEKIYFENLADLKNFSTENGKPTKGFRMDTKILLVLTKV